MADVPARLDYPNGFAVRLYHLIAALGARWTVDVVALLGTPMHETCGAVSAGTFVDPRLPVRDVIGVDVAAAAPAPAATGRVRKWFDYRGLPMGASPARAPELRDLVERTAPALVVLHHVLYGHLVHEIPASTPVVYAFEEAAGTFTQWTLGLNRRDVRQRLVIERERRRERHLYRTIAARPGCAVAISDAEARQLQRWAAPADPRVIKHGVDLAAFAPRIVDDPTYDVAVVGVLHQEARYRDALAVYTASRRSPDAGVRAWRWAFAGVGTEQLRPLVGAGAACGPVDDMRDVYAASRVIVVPTVEGVGVKTTVLEAWAMGRPVVASSRALRDLEIEPGVNVVVAVTAEETVAQVRALLDDSTRAERIGAAARETMLRHRDIRVLAADFAAICAEVAGATIPVSAGSRARPPLGGLVPSRAGRR